MEQLTAVLWRTILECEALLNEEDCPPERVLKAGHCLAQMAGAYKAVVEVVSIEERIATLERAAAERTNR